MRQKRAANVSPQDRLGNYMTRCEQSRFATCELTDHFARRSPSTGHGEFGEKLFVFLADTPYYKEGPKPEPIAYKDLLVTHLEQMGVYLDEWKRRVECRRHSSPGLLKSGQSQVQRNRKDNEHVCSICVYKNTLIHYILCRDPPVVVVPEWHVWKVGRVNLRIGFNLCDLR